MAFRVRVYGWEVAMNSEMERVLYEICLKAAEELGDDIKQLSWFGKNWTLNSDDKTLEEAA
jgi:hypothetical protein